MLIAKGENLPYKTCTVTPTFVHMYVYIAFSLDNEGGGKLFYLLRAKLHGTLPPFLYRKNIPGTEFWQVLQDNCIPFFLFFLPFPHEYLKHIVTPVVLHVIGIALTKSRFICLEIALEEYSHGAEDQ